MKKNNLFLSIICVLIIFLFACKKNYIIKTPYAIADSSVAYLKIIHVDPFFAINNNKKDTFNLLLNGVKMNGSPITYNSIFPYAVNPLVPNITNTYIAVKAGSQEIKLSYPGISTTDSIPVYIMDRNLEAGKKYSLFITDSLLTSNRDSSKILIQDNFTQPLTGFINIRFVHTIFNDTATKTVDLFSYAKNGTILTKFKPGDISSFISIGYNPQTIDTFYVTRTLGASDPANTPLSSRLILAKFAFTNSSSSPGNAGAASERTYTLFYKGDANIKTGLKARSLGVYMNQ